MKTPSLCFFALPLLLASCIDDVLPECPALQVTVEVKDKNYFNVDQIEQMDALDESLPFKSFIPTLCYTLEDTSTGKVVADAPLYEVLGNDTEHRITFPSDLPFGQYVLTIWGGLVNNNGFDDTRSSMKFHPNDTQGTDFYLSKDTIQYGFESFDHPELYQKRVKMERTKGLLLIETDGLPMTGSALNSVSGIYGKINDDFSYSGQAHLKNVTVFESNKPTMAQSYITPSISGRNSTLTIELFDDQDGRDEAVFKRNFDILTKRNEITLVKLDWDEELQRLQVKLWLNDQWDVIYDSEITD